MDFKVSVALHIVGIIMWGGGLLVMTRLFKLYVGHRLERPEVGALLSRMFFGYPVAGAVITIGTGLYQLLARGFAFYFSQGWFHGKITVVLLLIVVTVIVGFDLKKITDGELLSKSRISVLHGLIGLVILIAVFSTILGRVS